MSMILELTELLPAIPNLLGKDGWQTLLINKYEPIIHRLSYKISDTRTLMLHKLYNTKHALMHSHSWNFACKVIEGEYEMGIGFSQDRLQPPESIFTSFVKSGDIYEMSSPNIWHYTKPLSHIECTYSILLVGQRYRERMALNNECLSSEDKQNLLSWFQKRFNV